MLFSNLVHLKALLMVLTAAVGTVAGGTVLSSYVNGGKAGPSFLLTANPTTLTLEHQRLLRNCILVSILRRFKTSGVVESYQCERPDKRHSQVHADCHRN